MNFNNYQSMATATVAYPFSERIIYPALGLAEEAGEVVGKIAKWRRDGNLDHQAVKKELGDVLWMLAVLSHDLGFQLDDVAFTNLKKLEDRRQRGVIHGSGDNR